MKSMFSVAAIALAATVFTFSASGASLLGGLITTGADSGNSDSPISLGNSGDTTSLGLLGTGGLSVNLPTGGLGDLTGDGSNVGVPGVVDVSTTSSDGNTGATVNLLGGGSTISTNPLGLLGTNGGLNLGLPNTGINSGTNGRNGTNGTNGSNGGSPVINLFGSVGGGGNGGNGGNGLSGNGGNGGSFAIPSGISGRLQNLLRVLADRDYLRISNGRAVCLNSFGVAEVASLVPQKDWRSLQQALTTYSEDIYTLRQLLANCRSGAQRQALNITDLNRVIAIDIQGGQPVLYML